VEKKNTLHNKKTSLAEKKETKPGEIKKKNQNKTNTNVVTRNKVESQSAAVLKRRKQQQQNKTKDQKFGHTESTLGWVRC